MVIGHRPVLARLNMSWAPVSLFLGPRSVGKWTTAEQLRYKRGIDSDDTLRVPRLTMESAREIVRFTTLAPLGDEKLVIVGMAGASPEAQHALLKTLEEPGPYLRVVMIATTLPLPTLVSRSQVYEFGLLTDEEVAQILRSRKVKPKDAEALAQKAQGQVYRALDAEEAGALKPLVVLALKAIHERDPERLETTTGRWTEEHTELLTTWCSECITGQWHIFDPTDSEIIGTRLPLKILLAIRPKVRPKLTVRAQLMSVLRGER